MVLVGKGYVGKECNGSEVSRGEISKENRPVVA